MTRISFTAVLIGAALAAPLGAQTSALGEANYESRASLEAQLRDAETANRASEALVLRSRLQTGDFQDGDRIVVVLENSPAVTDTMQLRAGRVLHFPNMGEVSLAGVLRSELTDRLRLHLSKYLTNPDVRATALVPLGVFGSVRNPGFVYAPADYLLRDLLMRAGGPAPEAEVENTIVRRGGQTLWNVKDVRAAFASGLSLDRLQLRAGDEVYVPERRRIGLSTILSILSATAAVSVAATQLHHR